MILFNQSTISEIQGSIGRVAPEAGGMIGSREGVICKYYYDSSGKSTQAYYMPSEEVETIIRQWHLEGYTFEGFIHSHGSRFSPTDADIKYSLEVLSWYEDEFALSKEAILIPIVESIWMASPFQIHGFSVNKAGKLLQHKINTVEHLNLVIGACKKNQALKRT